MRYLFALVLAVATVAAVYFFAWRPNGFSDPVATGNITIAFEAPQTNPAGLAESSKPEYVTAQSSSSATRTDPVQIGSEGYGAHIDRALLSLDPQKAVLVLGWLQLCSQIEAKLVTFRRIQDASTPHPSLTQYSETLQGEARRCQTVTQEHYNALNAVGEIAITSNELGAGVLYAQAVNSLDLPRESRFRVAEAILKDAAAGHEESIMFVAFAGGSLEIDPLERLVFLEAFDQLGRPAHIKEFQYESALDAFGMKAQQFSTSQRAHASQRASQVAEHARNRRSQR